MTIYTFNIKDLMRKTDAYRDIDTVVHPDPEDSQIPKSIFKYNPVTWMEQGIYYTLLGEVPDKGIWTLGTTPLESMEQFDKELNLRLKDDIMQPISAEQFNEIHNEVFEKVCTVMGWNNQSPS